MLKRSLSVLVSSLLACAITLGAVDGLSSEALAATKKKPQKPAPKDPGYLLITKADELVEGISVEFQDVNSQTISKDVDCYQNVPGFKKEIKKVGTVLVKLSSSLKDAQAKAAKLKKNVKSAKALVKKDKKNKKYKKQLKKAEQALLLEQAKVKELTGMQSAAANACNIPQNFSLAADKGPFGLIEAQSLCERFFLGCTHTQLLEAVQIGREAFIAKHTAPHTLEAKFETDFLSMSCNTLLPEQTGGQPCDANDPNDLNRSGIQYGLLRYLLNTQQPYYWQLFLFLLDEFMALSMSNVDGCANYAILDHIEMVRRAATSGDMIQYAKDYNEDMAGNLFNLDGKENRGAIYGVNENYGREFWELHTIGVGHYNDLDIANASQAHAGWDVIGQNVDIGGNTYYICFKAFVPARGPSSPVPVFVGQPYQTMVRTAEDVRVATFNHPATAKNFAKKILQKFVHANPPEVVIELVAAELRKNNYNIHPVIQKIMRSKMATHPANREALMKDFLEEVISFLRITQLPFASQSYPARWDYEDLQNMLSPIVRILEAPTVFGNYQTVQHSAAKRTTQMSILDSFLLQSSQNLALKGFNYADLLNGMIRTGDDAADTVRHLALLLGVSVNDAQVAELSKYLKNEAQTCNQSAINSGLCVAGQSYYLQLVGFVADPAFYNISKKVPGLLRLLILDPNFSTR